jgi:NTP pyrophosphatase (non-canonical NTP hydrolase)
LRGEIQLKQLDELNEKLSEFARERDWEQFHSVKNLSMALAVEAGELMEHFQWLTQEQSNNLSEEKLEEVEQELADILIYLVRIAGRLDLDLFSAAQRKMRINEAKYPADRVRGSSRKYTEYVD